MFSPFKDLKVDGFSVEDIEWLQENSVSEGLYIEYKSRLVKQEKIANSIASFANTYGGWYIVGVEASKETNTPTAIPGISLKESRDPLATIREAVKEYLDPTPAFFSSLVMLPSGDVVAVIQIPDGQNKPIISRDGKIYRRVGDATDPVHEKDRAVVDRLVDEGKVLSQKFEDFCTDSRTHCKGEREQPWVNVYIQPYPDWLEPSLPLSQTELDALRCELSKPIEMTFGESTWSSSTNFSAVRTGARSTILSARGGTNLGYNNLLIELVADGWARLHFPLSTFGLFDLAKNCDRIETPDIQKLVQHIDRQDRSFEIPFIHAGNAMVGLMSVVRIYQVWLGEVNKETCFKYRIELDNVWRSVPYADTQEWADFIERCGFHLTTQNNIWQPPRQYNPLRTFTDDSLSLEVQIATQAMVALGLPIDLALSVFTDEIVRHAQAPPNQNHPKT